MRDRITKLNFRLVFQDLSRTSIAGRWFKFYSAVSGDWGAPGDNIQKQIEQITGLAIDPRDVIICLQHWHTHRQLGDHQRFTGLVALLGLAGHIVKSAFDELYQIHTAGALTALLF